VKLFAIMGVVLGGLALAIAPAESALAAVPPRGTVVEGHSIPGVALGATRQRVLATYGTPAFCLSPGEAICTWQRGKDAVSISFAGASGGNPAGTGRDRVADAEWTGLPGWRTTAGVTTASALAHPESVPAAYPHAIFYRFSDGHLRLLIDFHVGIWVQWVPGTSPGQYSVIIEIFAPSAAK
jgi:hypothetical protein